MFRKVVIWIFLLCNLLSAKTIVVDINYNSLSGSSDTCVNGDYKTNFIKDALLNAQSGDVIKICPGDYYEGNLNVNTWGLNIQSTTLNPEDVRVYNNKAANIFNIIAGNITFKGITVDQQKNNKYGIYLNSSGSYELDDVNINSKGYGIYVKSGINDLNLNNVYLDSKKENIYLNNDIWTTFTIINSTLTSSNEENIYSKGNIQTLTISNSSFKADKYTLNIDNSKNINRNLEINNTVINSDGIYTEGNIYGDLIINDTNITSSKYGIYVSGSVNNIEISDTNMSSSDKSIYVNEIYQKGNLFNDIVSSDNKEGFYINSNASGEINITSVKMQTDNENIYVGGNSGYLYINDSELNSTSKPNVNIRGSVYYLFFSR